MEQAMVREYDRRARGFGFLVVGLMFSLLLHGALLSYFFVRPRMAVVEESQEAAQPLTVADRLASADSSILEGSAALLERVKRKRQEMFGIMKETPEPQWTIAAMPRMLVRGAERVGIDLKSTAVVPANGQAKTYNITMDITTTPEKVFEDLLTLGHWVGIGTGRSDFSSDKLVITVNEKDRGRAGLFAVSTRDCRLLSAGKLSAENFIVRGRIEESG